MPSVSPPLPPKAKTDQPALRTSNERQTGFTSFGFRSLSRLPQKHNIKYKMVTIVCALTYFVQ